MNKNIDEMKLARNLLGLIDELGGESLFHSVQYAGDGLYGSRHITWTKDDVIDTVAQDPDLLDIDEQKVWEKVRVSWEWRKGICGVVDSEWDLINSAVADAVREIRAEETS